MGFGNFFTKIFGKIGDGLSLKILSGIFFLATIWTFLSFFFPLNIIVEISTICIGFASFFYFKNYENVWVYLEEYKYSTLILVLLIIFFGSFSPFILDHFGYYVPTIKWISEVGLVKGISNLDLILGQMSTWHILQAGFSNFTDSFLKINAVVLLVYAIYILEKKTWIHFCLFPVLFFFVQSPSPDLPAIVFSLMVLQEILLGNKKVAQLFLISIFIFTIKPTLVWLPIFTLFYSIFYLKVNLKFSIVGVLLFILFLIKNMWTFGYPIFPMTILDLGISWKSNPALMQLSSEMAKMKTYDMQFSYSEIQEFTFWGYIEKWFLIGGIKSKMHYLFIISLIVFSVFTFIKKKKIIYYLWVAIIIKSIFVLLFSAQYRFFIDVFFVIFIVLFFELKIKKLAIIFSSVLSFCLIVLFTFPKIIQSQIPSFRLGEFFTGFQKEQWYQPPEYVWKKSKEYTIGNLTFNIVQNYPFSFDTDLPAISPSYLRDYLKIGIFPKKIGDNLKQGFIYINLSEKEKVELKEIIKNQE